VICAAKCGRPIGETEFIRLDAGVRISTGEVVAHDVNLHRDGCYGVWMQHHYPWTVQTRERTRL
jgi:hypothetical protein